MYENVRRINGFKEANKLPMKDCPLTVKQKNREKVEIKNSKVKFSELIVVGLIVVWDEVGTKNDVTIRFFWRRYSPGSFLSQAYKLTIRQSNGITRTPTKTGGIRLTVLSV